MEDALSVYIPMDRRQALAYEIALPERTVGAGLFADISGFTPLTEVLVQEFGPQRGSEVLTYHLNQVYDALITELHQYGGSVIVFSGDAITCWFDRDNGSRAVACALAMQKVMERFSTVEISANRVSGEKEHKTVSLAMKTAVAVGPARRFVVGDPQIQIMDVLAGTTLDQLATAEHYANKGEVLVDVATFANLSHHLHWSEWREDKSSRQRFCVVREFDFPVVSAPWSRIAPGTFDEATLCPWLLPQVYERLRRGQGEFLAELRPAVALFVRFGGIDYDDDPDSGRKLDTFTREVQRILAYYGSPLLQLTIGDKGSYLYATFGAPLSYEDNEIRAASAAIELRALALRLDFISSIQIGISEGRMRAGAYGGTMRRTYGVLGDEVNLAARLMQAAAPGQILVSKHAQEPAADVFDWQALVPIQVKGKSKPIPVFSLERFKQQRTAYLQAVDYKLPMVGREAELSIIREKVAQALAGVGQIVGVTAEAGVGKSRLVAEGVKIAQANNFLGYGGECQSYGTNTSYLVWQDIWWSFFGLDPGWDLEQQIESLENQLEYIDSALLSRLPLLGTVLNLPIPDNDLTRSLDAKLRKTALQSLLVDCVRARAYQTPLLFVLEDAHWMDSLSQELLEVIGESIQDVPVFMLIAYRLLSLNSHQELALRGLSNFFEISLSDFTVDEASRLIDLKIAYAYGEDTPVSPEFVKRITARAEGNPFYIEELLNYLHSLGLGPQQVQSLDDLDLPTSLHSLILSRIDQLSENQKSTLKVASVVGRLFRATWLWGAYPQLGDKERIKTDLEILRRLDLTVLDSPEPELTYLFKHIVTQEVAYESLPYAMRAILHEYIGRFIEMAYTDNLDQYVDLLAYHYFRSDNEFKKREYLRRAGDAAQANYANDAALNYYQRLLALLAGDEQIPVMLKIGPVLERVGRWQDADKLYREIMQLSNESGNRLLEVQGQAALGDLLRKQGQYDEAAIWLQRAQFGFDELENNAGVGRVLHCAGTLAAQQGDYEAAKVLYKESLEIRETLDDKLHIAALLNNLAIIARFQGDLKLARSLYEDALSIWRELGDKWAIAIALNNMGNLLIDEGDYVGARNLLEEAVELHRQVGDRWNIANSLNNLGNAVRSGARSVDDCQIAYELYKESLEINYNLGDKRALAYLFEDIGCMAALQGDPRRSLCLVGFASALREEIGTPLSTAEKEKLEQRLEVARRELDPSTQSAILVRGHSMSLAEGMACALLQKNLSQAVCVQTDCDCN